MKWGLRERISDLGCSAVAAAWLALGAAAAEASTGWREAWEARDGARWGECARRHARLVHAHERAGRHEEAARSGYWAVRCAVAAGEAAGAGQWQEWVEQRRGTLHGQLAQLRRQTGDRSGDLEVVLEAMEKVESNGNEKARSPKGALGAMQVLPSTAAGVLREAGRGSLGEGEIERCLMDGPCNRRVAWRYMNGLMEEFGYSLVHALAAYNAGPGRVRRWMRRIRTRDPVEWMDRIPFRETRSYVAKVLVEMGRRRGGETWAVGELRALRWPIYGGRGR